MALEIGKTYYIKNVATGKYLNVYGTDTVANSRNVNTYAKEDCLAQKWTVGLYGNGARVYTAINSAYALNINTSNNNCTMYLAASNSEADSVVDFLTVSASNNQYRIKMMAHNKYLSVTTSDDNAYWASSADSYSLWQLEEVSTSSTIVTTAPTALVDQTFFVKNYNTGYNLNVYGTDTVADERNVNVYSKENCLAQKWIVRQKTDGAKLCTVINENFVLNINTGTNNCSMHTESTNDSEDCVLEFVPYTDATVTSADKVYRIKMANHNLYLDVESAGSGANAYWVSGTSGYSLWQFITEEDMFPTAPDAPSEIVGSTFAIKAHGTNFNLNVHGTDTVVDERNVNIYSKEDCLAQRWVVKNTDTGPKLYTKINEDFAINHYTVDDNCTMYTDSTDNDEDSILEFQKVSDMLYRIKLFNSDKYMTIDGTAESGTNVIWSDTASTATLWEFIPEATMFPAPAAAPTAIVGSTFFIKNFYTGYNLNVHGIDTVANGRNVNVYSKENCLAQKWQVIQTDRGPKIVTAIDSTFALNIYSEDNPNCTMYKADVSNIDTVLEFEPYTDATTTAADKVYKIKMFHHGKYLDAEGIGSGYNVKWSETPFAPLWQFVTEKDMFPPAEEAADGIIDRTFFIQNVNTGYFLNINGNETVSNTAQVNVYAKENVQAQRWIIRNTTAGPKMLTKLNENFALNIYAKDNNCTMYDAAVSDTDTVLEIIPYSESDNIYRIKMHYHGRYLNVSGVGIGATCYWTTDDTATSTLWRLIPESEMTFEGSTEADTTPDSPLVKPGRFLAMPTGTYMVGRDGINISEITIHHTADVVSSIDQIYTSWINSGRAVSSHYCVKDHDIVQFVKECNTAYTNGGDLWDPTDTHYNHRAITIETCNSAENEDWPVSDASLETLIALVADIARRNNLGTLVVGQNLTWHKKYANTECPGPYLMARLQYIADEANAINDESVFIRKLGTQYPLVLSSTASNEGYGVAFSEKVSESNQKWIIKDTTEGKEIINAFDITQNLRLNSTNDAFVVSSDENLSKAYLITSEDNAEKFSIRAAVNSVLRTVTYVWMGVSIAGISVVDAENKGEFVDTSTKADAPPAQLTPAVVPTELDDWRFKIKNGEYYITVTGQDISLSGKTTDPNQVFEIENSYMGPNIKSLSETNSYLSINPLNNEPFSILPMVIDRNTSLNIKFEPLNQTTHPNQYYIHSLRYDKYLGVDKSNPLLAAGELMWGKYTPDTYENFIWTLEEPEPKPINDWLVAYYNPQDRANARNVEIPNYAYRLPKSDEGGNFEEVDCFIRKDATGNDILFEFTNKNYWFAQESGFSDYVPEAVLNTYGVSETTLPRKATQGTYKDYYWVAVGPNVIKSNYPDDGRPGSEMYGLGTLDAVISDAEGRIYYIPCIPGDIKAHSWNNGVFQTYLRYFNPYENTDSSIDQYDVALRDDTAPYIVEMKKYNLTSYNKTACIEFIGYDLNLKGEKITMPETSLNKYSIERIIFYDNPIV